MDNPWTAILSKNPQQTRALGERLGGLARPGDVILLSGNLGAGKTCFTQGLAKGMGIFGRIQSPTFVLVREMEGSIPLYHVDLYRLQNLPEIEDLGLDSYFYGPGVTVVEWADKGRELLPDRHLLINIDIQGENERLFTLIPSGKHYEDMIEALNL